jgi:hypothetical protein
VMFTSIRCGPITSMPAARTPCDFRMGASRAPPVVAVSSSDGRQPAYAVPGVSVDRLDHRHPRRGDEAVQGREVGGHQGRRDEVGKALGRYPRIAHGPAAATGWMGRGKAHWPGGRTRPSIDYRQLGRGSDPLGRLLAAGGRLLSGRVAGPGSPVRGVRRSRSRRQQWRSRDRSSRHEPGWRRSGPHGRPGHGRQAGSIRSWRNARQRGLPPSAASRAASASRACGCRKPTPPGDIHESRLRHDRVAGPGNGPGR